MSAEPRPQGDIEARIRETGLRLYTTAVKTGLWRSASSFLAGRSLQRRLLTQAMADPDFKTQLFRFVDVYPSFRDALDLVRHLRAYFDDGALLPSPFDRLLATGTKRLPTWAVARLTEKAMARMAGSLIAGRDAIEALPTLKRLRRRQTGFTLDVLGEACLSEAEAAEYMRRYHDLLDILPGKAARWSAEPAVDEAPWGLEPRVNLSLKLSSLYSQLDPADFEGSRQAILTALKPLAVKARERNVFLNLDVERFVHRDLTYAVFTDLCLDPDLRDYPYLGVAVQAYLPDSEETVRRLIQLAHERETPLTVRLVKGAYWDYETILAAQEHWPPPVFLTKAETDRHFEHLAGVLVEAWPSIRLAVGTHNLRSIAAALALAEVEGLPDRAVEIQVLHGMADAIRRAVAAHGLRVREYVPVGELIPGMAYLVRRLLENTANESCLRLTFLQCQSPESLLAPPPVMAAGDRLAAFPDNQPAPIGVPTPGEVSVPVEQLELRSEKKPEALSGSASPGSPRCRLPDPLRGELPGPFQNEPHADFSRTENRTAMERALATIRASLGREYGLLINGESVMTGHTIDSVNPADSAVIVGRVALAGTAEANQALTTAVTAFPAWRDTPAAERAGCLFRAAHLMRERRFELSALEVVEAGKPWREADADVTEAIDFLEYYGREVLRLSRPRELSDVPGEEDVYFYEPRGVAVVIAPWNFPLAIPAGMVSAALATGNTVVFKPASATPVLGYALVRLLQEAGVPGGAVNFLPGHGAQLGDYLVGDPRVDLVAFTGSLETGLSIMQKAALVAPGQRSLKKVVAELGGKNAIIIDSDADLDAAVEGVIVSAFNYSGQKCSACSRVIALEPVYEQFLKRLVPAVASLRMGDPAAPATRVGPVISAEARDRILRYIAKGKEEANLVWPRPVPEEPGDRPPETVGTVRSAAVSDPAEGAERPEVEPSVSSAALASLEAEPAGAPATPAQGAAAPADRPTDLNPQGFFVQPHVFTDVPPQAVIAQEEIFGPVLAVMRAATLDEAFEIALGVRYALTGGLYSRNPANIRRAYHEFRVGNLYINRPITGAMVGRQPFGGSSMSGIGSKAGGPDYLLQFLEPRTVTENTVRRGFAPTDIDAASAFPDS